MSQKTPIEILENHIFTNDRQDITTAKFLNFALILLFGAFIFLSTAENARAATFVVDRTDDNETFSACTVAADDCALRGAISSANTAASDDVIIFDSSVFLFSTRIVLNGSELAVANNGSLTINGIGVDKLFIDGNQQSRVFSVQSSATLLISNLTVTRGRNLNDSSGGGGGILNYGTLYLFNIKLDRNGSFLRGGGGIYNTGNLNITDSTVSNNSALPSGGGIYTNGGIVIINGLTINNNSANNSGGGIFASGGGTVNLTNSTVYRNESEVGAGIFNSGIINLNHITVSNNFSGSFLSGGGGVSNNGSLSSINSIIANNNAQNAPDYSGTLTSLGYNLIENTSGTTINGNTTGNILGQDPRFDPNGLQNNGGATQTVALLPGSPAIDAANPNNFPSTDQRGVLRPVDGDGNGSALPDIGAFEASLSLVVTKTADTNDGICDSDCSLREAIAFANSTTADETITFSPNVFSTAQSIFLIGGDLRVLNNGKLTINGPGRDLLTISGNNQSRIFSLTTNSNVSISNLTIANGNGNGTEPSREGFGGAIFTAGTLNLSNVIVKNSQASSGGGIYSFENLPITIRNSIIQNNQAATNTGGGINIRRGELIVSDTSILSNSATQGGGGIYVNSVNTSLVNSVMRNNTSTNKGGGLLCIDGGCNLQNTTIDSNRADGDGGGGIFAIDGAVTLANSNITNNNSTSGGGINCTRSSMTITNSTIDGNRAGFGGGITKAFTEMTINGSTISNNISTSGAGGIWNRGGLMTIINSTISGNRANADGGGINNFATLILLNVTIARNTADYGGGVSTSGTVTARNTIIGDNTNSDYYGNLNAEGYVLLENQTGANISTTMPQTLILGQDPQLLPLGNYGGTTKTHALRPTSPAIDKGLITGNLTTDQRGRTRTVDFPNIPNANGGDGSDIGSFERQLVDVNAKTPFDFDGDGKADLSVFRPNNGYWYIQQSANGFRAQQFGLSNDTLVPGDYDGDGKTDLAVFRKSSDSTWYILQSSDNSFRAVQFGAPNQGQAILFDTPVPADYDGDGKTDLAYFRQTDNLGEPTRFNILRSSDNTTYSVQWGSAFDRPIPADYDGDGKADIAVNRGGIWYIVNSSNGQFVTIQFGTAQDKLVPADYDGDGKTDIAVFRPSNGTWYYLRSGNGNSFTALQFGTSEDRPVPADYDGDGKAEIAVFRPSAGSWYYLSSTSGGFVGVSFGVATDKPVPAAFIQ